MGLGSAVFSLHSVTHPLLLLQQTHAGSLSFSMEWEEVRFASSSDDPLQICAPESFFDPRLETLDTFPKNFLTDYSLSSSDFSIRDQTLGEGAGQDEFPDILDSTFDEALLSDGSLSSVLTSDEIFSQIEICSDLLDESRALVSPADVSPASEEDRICIEDYALSEDIEDQPQPLNEVAEQPQDSSNLVIKRENNLSEDYAQYDINLEKVEYDIAKLKQEVIFLII